MTILECTRRDGIFEEYRIELTDRERRNTVDGATFRALNTIQRLRSRYGVVVAAVVAVPLAVWVDLITKK